MRIAIVSDIHANLPAWNAVLADTAARSVDKIICLGDTVGYGPQPAEALSSVYANVDHFVLGNHDAVVGGLMEPAGFNPVAGKLIEHTRRLLGDRARRFFNGIPLSLRHKEFRFSHGSAAAPEKFTYVISRREAMEVWNRSDGNIICIGHTHIPRLHILTPSGRYQRLKAPGRTVALKADHRYIINCGSVGLPRDEDFRAGYVTIDTEAKTVGWHRIAYDIAAFRHAVQGTYKDPELVDFLLRKIDQKAPRPIRELIDFTPGRSRVSEKVTAQQDMERVKIRLMRWQVAAVSIFLMLLLLAAGAAAIWRNMPRRHIIKAAGSDPIRARALTEGWTYDLLSAESPPRRPLPESWSADFSDAGRQTLSYSPGRLQVVSESRHPLSVSLQPISVEHIGSITWEMEGSVRDNWDGQTPVLVLDYTDKDGSVREGAERIPLRREEQRLYRTRTITLPASARRIRPHISFNAAGSARIDTIRAGFTPTAEKALLLRGPIDLNRASAEELESIPGIGPALAGRIVAFREREGKFENVGQLTEIDGIGRQTVAGMEQFVEVNIR